MSTFFNEESFRRGETPSAGIHASARGLASLGVYMANKGSYGNKTLISEETWRKLHSNPKVEHDIGLMCRTAFTAGGLSKYG